jgi:hypothetical protein
MITKTAYKVLSIKGVNYLQYLKPYRLLWFFKLYRWEYIPYPNEKGKPQVITDRLHEYLIIRKFVLKYPDIDEYFKTEYVERKKKFKTVKSK